MRHFDNLDLETVDSEAVYDAIVAACLDLYNHQGQLGFIVPMVEGSHNLMAAAAHLTYSADDYNDVIADLFMMAKTVDTVHGPAVYFPGVNYPFGR